MSTIATATATEHITIQEFVRQLGYSKGTHNILAACYYAEFVEGLSDFGVTEINRLLDAAKIPRPGNLQRDLKTLADSKKKYLNVVRGTSGPTVRYTITTVGADIINAQMQYVGLVISKPVERTELIKQMTESLHSLIQNIPDIDEREYVEEALSCLSPVNNAPRAAVVMAWTGAVYNLRKKVDKQGALGYASFTSLLQAGYPRYKKPITTFNDLEDIKDGELLDICEKMDIIKGKSVKTQLVNCLDFRNGVGHPTNVKPGINKVKAFFEDVIQYILAEP